MTFNAIFRCDASSKIGSGHVRRCLILAQHLKSNGIECFFIMRDADSNSLIEEVSQYFAVYTLPKENLTQSLSSDQQQLDSYLCADAIRDMPLSDVHLLVVDSYDIDILWERSILQNLSQAQEFLPKLVVIDDLANRHHLCDLLVDQNYYGPSTNERYKGLIPYRSIKLLGSKYAMMHQDFAVNRSTIQPRLSLKNILIYFGGTDEGLFSLSALKGVIDSCLDQKDITIKILLSPQSKAFSDVNEFCSQLPNVSILSSLPNLAQIISWADLCIGAGGSSTWERACLGLPCITFILADNQYPISNQLSHELQSKYFCRAFDDIYSTVVSDIYTIHNDLNAYSKVSSELMNYNHGLGATYVSRAIVNLLKA